MLQLQILQRTYNFMHEEVEEEVEVEEVPHRDESWL